MSFILSELCPGQYSKFKYEQMAINPKSRQGRVMFFSTALLPNEIYLPTKFHVDISYSVRVIFRTMFIV
jgi:hypothetical protein